jgi:hypothetical protein
VLASCGVVKEPTDYTDTNAQKNFVQGCHVDRTVANGKITETELAPTNVCTCIFISLRDKERLPWSDLMTYEKAVANAKPGNPPDPPAKVKKAIDRCATAGPAVESATTTTAAP